MEGSPRRMAVAPLGLVVRRLWALAIPQASCVVKSPHPGRISGTVESLGTIGAARKMAKWEKFPNFKE